MTGTTERIINDPDEEIDPEAPTTLPLGVYLCRGASVATIGLLDEEKDSQIDWSTVCNLFGFMFFNFFAYILCR